MHLRHWQLDSTSPYYKQTTRQVHTDGTFAIAAKQPGMSQLQPGCPTALLGQLCVRADIPLNEGSSTISLIYHICSLSAPLALVWCPQNTGRGNCLCVDMAWFAPLEEKAPVNSFAPVALSSHDNPHILFTLEHAVWLWACSTLYCLPCELKQIKLPSSQLGTGMC